MVNAWLVGKGDCVIIARGGVDHCTINSNKDISIHSVNWGYPWCAKNSPQAINGLDFDYFTVVERGGQTSRLHLHTIFIFRNLPKEFRRCPNIGRPIPDYEKIKPFEQFWKFGTIQGWKPIRFGMSDAWSNRSPRFSSKLRRMRARKGGKRRRSVCGWRGLCISCTISNHRFPT